MATPPKPRSRRCTWCGHMGATSKQRDAANALHHFHKPCVRSMAFWLGAEPVPQGPPKGHVCTRGCER